MQITAKTTRLILAPRDGFIVPAEPGKQRGSGKNAGDVDAFRAGTDEKNRD